MDGPVTLRRTAGGGARRISDHGGLKRSLGVNLHRAAGDALRQDKSNFRWFFDFTAFLLLFDKSENARRFVSALQKLVSSEVVRILDTILRQWSLVATVHFRP
jgi:hypothetical protein